MSLLSKPYFHDEAAAFSFLESVLWAAGSACPHCGTIGEAGKLAGVMSKASNKNPEGTPRHGLWKCYACRKQFTVRVGTVFESAHIPLHKMLQAVYLLTSSKKGISAHQLHRTIEITYKSAWFLAHRIREAMRTGTLEPFGSGGTPVQVAETFIGREPGKTNARAYHHKMKVLTLVDRESGRAVSTVVDDLKSATLAPIISENMAREARLMTDEAAHYNPIGRQFAEHGVVRHAQEGHVIGGVHTNTIEGYFSIFKRGRKGVYQHCSKKHLHRYLAEYDFRYSNRVALGVEDAARATLALRGIVGKRLTYRYSFGVKQ